MPSTLSNLIHVAKIFNRGGWQYLYLHRSEEGHYIWNLGNGEGSSATSLTADSAEEAIRLAKRHFRLQSFTTLRCGFRFTLPERDEIGGNALFHQMVASYSTMNGVYVDEELGHQCVVNDASQEALALWAKFRQDEGLTGPLGKPSP